MNEAKSEETNGPEGNDGGLGTAPSPGGMSPYATGGGGVTFERKVAVQYLAHLLVGDSAGELGDGRCVVSVAFQQAPSHPVDDLVVSAARPDELQPSLVLALGVRRSPEFVLSDESTRKLILGFVRAVINAPTDGPEHRLGLVVAGPQAHAKQLAKLANLAAAQMDAPGFFDLVRTPNRFDAGIRDRLDHFEQLVTLALHDLGVAEANTALVKQRAWQLLARLTVSMPRLESPDEMDWAAVANSLISVARGSALTGASQLRDRLVTLASEYSPRAAHVDLRLLRRDAHMMLDPTVRRHKQGWQALDHLHDRALASVRDEIAAGDWAAVANSLISVARGSALTGASQLRDRLVTLASEYSPRAAHVDLRLLRRDAHMMLDPTVRRHKQGWQALDHLHDRALASVRDEIAAGDGIRRVRLDRSGAAMPWCTTRDLGPQLSCTHGFEVPHEHFQTHSAEVCEEGLSREELA